MWENQEIISDLLFSIWILGGITFLLIAVLLIWRMYRLIVAKKRVQKEEVYSKVILSYLKGERSKEKVYAYLSSHRINVSIFVQVCIDLMQNLWGDSHENIEELLAHEKIQNHYIRKLKAAEERGLAEALTFFSFYTEWDQRVADLVQPLVMHENTEISYAAALVLIKSTRFNLRKRALRKVCSRHDISKVTILELAIVFMENENMESKRGDTIGYMAMDTSLPLKSRYVLVETIGELRLVQQAPKLYILLESVIKNEGKTDSRFTGGIIKALGKLQWPQVLPFIRELLPSATPVLKSFCAKALGALEGQESIFLLEKLLSDSDRSIKVEAINQLLKHGKLVLPHLLQHDREEAIPIRTQTIKEIKEVSNYVNA